MTTTGEVALSYQLALKNQLDITANNIANMATPGFQSSHPIFAEFLVSVGETGEEVAYVVDTGTVRNLNPGPANFTGNPLDITIEGRGYFVVENEDGISYTRNGAFRLDASGQLVTSSGATVLNEGNDPIVIAPGESQINISSDGTINTENGAIGRFRLVEFTNEQAMTNLGDSLLASEEEPVEAADASVVQGMLEGSNVISVTEISRMIQLLRSYQTANQLITTEDEREQQAIETLTRAV
ncbi:MAG: flagellar basal-body rod protein FlgF [Alphaproteobacteria bacterium]|nr:flagellar basal-body rod protein FlgF [Alphaproteobacteria bacterium]